MSSPSPVPASGNPGNAVPDSASTPHPPRRRSWLKILAWTLGILALAILVTLYVIYRLATSIPDYWDKNKDFLNHTSPDQVKRLADDVQRRALTDFSSTGNGTAVPGSPLGTGQTTRMTFTLQEINSWLSANLEAWLSHKSIQLPPQIGKFMIATENNNRVLVACEVNEHGVKEIITLVLKIQIQADAKAFVQLESVRTGSIAIPAPALLAAMPEPPNSRAHAVGDSVQELLSGTTIDPILHIDKTRQARVTDLELTPDTIVVTFKTQKRE